MNQRALFLVCSVLGVLSSIVSCNPFFDDRYINLRVYEGNPTLERTKVALKKIGATENDKRETVREKIQLSLVQAEEPFEQNLYKNLIRLTEPHQKLSDPELRLVLKISLLLRDDRGKEWKGVAEFIKECGRNKFGERSKNIFKETYVPHHGRYWGERMLDEFFAALTGLKAENPGDEVMFEATRLFDLGQNALRAREALKIAKQSNISSKGFVDYLMNMCKLFQYEREDMFNVIALADAFGYEGRHDSDYLKKLKEYNRLCLSLVRPGRMNAIESNIERALKNSSSS